MDSDLISKKELLELTGISYGQLYRWKRKNLIPEEWFVKKSAFTGQETFFPRESILARIDKIKGMKEDRSLDDIAGVFSPALGQTSLTIEEVRGRKIVLDTTIQNYFNDKNPDTSVSLQTLLSLFVMDRLLHSGDVGIDEAKSAVKTMEEGYGSFEGKACELVVIRKTGVSFAALLPATSPVHFEQGLKVAARINLAQCVEELNMLL
ncbi:MAG TPA: YhbD family protein [Bacteroidota bacterium]|nr:YhbD family protein [Bacteroidota bacterium]